MPAAFTYTANTIASVHTYVSEDCTNAFEDVPLDYCMALTIAHSVMLAYKSLNEKDL